MGWVALHGGGEFLPGDEAVLGALLASAETTAAPGEAPRPIRIAVVPTAAARGRPEHAAANGVTAFERVAADLSLDVAATAVLVLDVVSAADPTFAATLAAADVIHLPGGDPDLIPAIYPDSMAWTAIRVAVDRGAVLAGASAGAMALGSRTWTPTGVVDGLDLVPGVIVMPHADAGAWARNVGRFATLDVGGAGVVGLAERTAIVGRPGAPWRVVGEGAARWLAPGRRDPDVAVVALPGTTLELV